MATVLHSAPRIASSEGVLDTLSAALGSMLVDAKEEFEELVLTVRRDSIEDALRLLRDEHQYQQLMEIAGADYPSRVERFEVVYMLLSLTKNHRVMVKVTAAENTPVPTVTTLWPVAGWLEREVFDMYGVVFAGNQDLRRILTDYGFEGHPFRKDFPLTGYHELRYSEEDKRVVYEPVKLAQDLRSFDFLSPWEGADYVLPGDEKASAKPAAPSVAEPKTTEKPGQSGAAEPSDSKAEQKVAPSATTSGTIAGQGQSVPTVKTSGTPEPGAPEPTASKPDRPAEGPASDKQGGGPAPEGS
ncbi:NADH-quinone oxidoreductase subunit C [Novosphingobium chloroacetimidivorans]|uniref:NADH-quinone oxidoreductase subunit C n=1 Tax=Novosphingobium chloroacetimidivorans TaxID=1428314 RepID=A0A7W7K7D4_9SPHN|nr:NADH-quinone oxidoreductase subunit C [Novosphingobium chloroacetimidivorans]MBB4857109.1 NADH-quinone oxidoreductase subunit C [Novosphingobium chloroacetimidivorans]